MTTTCLIGVVVDASPSSLALTGMGADVARDAATSETRIDRSHFLDLICAILLLEFKDSQFLTAYTNPQLPRLGSCQSAAQRSERMCTGGFTRWVLAASDGQMNFAFHGTRRIKQEKARRLHSKGAAPSRR